MNTYSLAVEIAFKEQDRAAQSEKFFNDPAAWAVYMLGEDAATLWSKQREIAQSVAKNKSTAVKAGHGVGKSMLVAVLVCWWIDTRGANAFVASTAPSQAQISAIVWKEVRKFYNLAKKRYKAGLIDHELPGYITSDNQWKMEGGIILGFGRKPPDNKEGDFFQGIHGSVLAIGDEACGLSEDMIDALGNITSNENSRRILIANPTNPSSHLAKIFKEAKDTWTLFTISVLDSPNFTGEPMPQAALENLTGPSYVEDKKIDYGEDSPRFKARVLGEFAYDLGDTLIKPEDIAVALDTEIIPAADEPVILGVDVARFGKDASVIYSNQGGVLRYVDSNFDAARVTETANWVHRHAINENATEVRIDALGIGGGVVDSLMSFDPPPRYTIVAMNSNGTTPDRKQHHNARAYWWDEFRRNLRTGLLDLDQADENSERLQDELMSVEYKFSTSTGGLLVESKEDMRKRGMKSPDFADAAIMAGADMEALFASGPKPGEKVFSELDEIIGEMPVYLQLMSRF